MLSIVLCYVLKSIIFFYVFIEIDKFPIIKIWCRKADDKSFQSVPTAYFQQIVY